MTQDPNKTNDETPSPSWFIDDGIPGVGERPSWLHEKFKTTADLAKSYNELEKKFGMVPEDYDLSKAKYINPDYEPIHEFLALAKEKRVSKDVIDKMVESFDKYIDEFSIDQEEEFKKLGANAKERLNTLDNWAKANLSKESYDALAGNLKTANAIKGLEELRGKMMSSNPVVPNGNEASSNNVQSIKDIQSEMTNNLEKYKTDAKYRDDIRSRLEIAVKNSNYVDKVGM